jgi:hypothetical protein
VHLWKKFSAWVKRTQHRRFAMVRLLIKRIFRRAREIENGFPICVKTSILPGFSLYLSIHAVTRGDVARERFARRPRMTRPEESKARSGLAYTVR